MAIALRWPFFTAAILAAALLQTKNLAAQTNYYYGNFHAHSAYSDGNQDSLSSGRTTPAQDFDFAKLSLHFDFLGISDHNHSSAGMTLAQYHEGVTQSNAATTANFVAMYGMEWGVTTGTGTGHVLVYGIDSLIGWQSGVYDIFNAQADYAGLYAKINARPNSVLSLAHPQTGDFNNIEGTSYSATADATISGMSIRSGYAFSTTQDYTDNPATLYETFFHTLLGKGYHVGPSIDHDNHNTTFGRTLPGRTCVLAPSLTKANIISAMKNMHYFATDDWNAVPTFTVSGQIMGNVASIAGDPSISVSVTDGDGEGVSSIQIWSGTPGSGSAPTVLASNTNQTSLTYTHPIAVGQTRYYYAKIKQLDGDYIWTAPIWVTKNTTMPVELVSFKAEVLKTQIALDWEAASETGLAAYEIERSIDGEHFVKIGEAAPDGSPAYSFIDETAPRGLLFYRLRMRDSDGSGRFSNVVSLYFEKNPVSFINLSPNPASDFVRLQFESLEELGEVECGVFDLDGRLVRRSFFDALKGENRFEVDLSGLKSGTYLIALRGEDGRIFLERPFMAHG